jgi:nitroreductase
MKIKHSIPAVIATLLMALSASASGNAPAVIKLDKPDLSRGLPVMQALEKRASATEWSDKAISLKDLSDLLWAANGINRPDSGKRTAPSALNAQDVDIYVFTTEAVYRYDPAKNELDPVTTGDHREEVVLGHGGKPVLAPMELILVSEGSRFPFGTPQQRKEWGLLDVGIVSQNIAVFCSATGLATRPRGSVNAENARRILNLKDGANVVLDQPVGFAK